jgi:hypothetical protein
MIVFLVHKEFLDNQDLLVLKEVLVLQVHKEFLDNLVLQVLKEY